MDRPLATAILASVAIHIAVLAAFLYASTLEGPVLLRPSRHSERPTISLALLPAQSQTTTTVAPPPEPGSSGAPQSLTLPLPRSRIESDHPLRPDMPTTSAAVAQDTKPSGFDPQAQTADGSALAAADHPIAVDPAAGIDYRQRLLLHIAGFRRRVAFADADPTGTVRVRFAIRRDGSVSAVTIAAGSGIAELDDEAVATIWRAQPMPPIPTVLPDSLSITLPITFGVVARTRG